MSMALQVTGLRELVSKLKRAKKSMRSWENFYRRVAMVAADSIQDNFIVGGRPSEWIPSKRALRTGTRTLIDTGRLFNSITPDKIRRKVVVQTLAGLIGRTLVLGPPKGLGYGPNLHVGGPGYPARPWFLLQDRDVNLITMLASDSVRREKFAELLR